MAREESLQKPPEGPLCSQEGDPIAGPSFVEARAGVSFADLLWNKGGPVSKAHLQLLLQSAISGLASKEHLEVEADLAGFLIEKHRISQLQLDVVVEVILELAACAGVV